MVGERPGDSAPPGADEFPAVSLYLYVPDVDATVEAAAQAGAKVLTAPGDKFYGNREGGILDPFGVTWWVATHRFTMTMEELQEGARAARG